MTVLSRENRTNPGPTWCHILLFALSACTQPDAPAAAPDEIATFVVGEPEVVVGRPTGDEPDLLHGVSDATLQSDGSMVLVNCSVADVRYFDANGTHIRTVGRRGDGPGDFQVPQRVFRLGNDTVAVYDLFGRVTVLGPSGEVATTTRLGSPVESLSLIGRLSNGLYVARRYEQSTTVEPNTDYRETASIILLTPDGVVADSLIGLPSGDVRSPDGPRRPRFGLRLARLAVFAVHPDAVYYGGQDGAGITVLGPNLEPLRTVSTITRPRPITEEDRRAYQAMRDAQAHVPSDGIVGVTVDAYAPEMPAFGDIIAGRDGRLWVEDPVRPGLHPLVWTAYDNGAAVARVELPVRFFPFEFGQDWVLGVSYDQTSVETVELRPLVPGPLPGLALPPRDAQPPARPRCGAWASR